MKLGKIALKVRLAETRFGSNIAGTAELDMALKNTLMKEAAFIVPLEETVTPNNNDNAINQSITEKFGVVCAIKCDASQSDKTGLAAYDSLFTVRMDLFRALLGWQLREAESIISYAGGQLLGIDGAWLWYQFSFQYQARIISSATDIRYANIMLNEANEAEDDNPTPFDKLYSNFILAPNEDELPYTGDLPLPDGYPDVLIPDIAQMIDLT